MSLERKLKGEEKIKRKKRKWELRAKAIDRGNKHLGRIQTTNASTTVMVQEAGDIVNISRTYLNRRDGINKCNSSEKLSARIRRKKRNEKKFLYNRGR